ncbi:WD40 domain-containing protein [Cephalotus follicularis]|uniref:WD40 domain-containing protein n=1 Tax=Cephalotus follicularis TaxID=3775 RepID=A0A1Q3AUZ8_CEPFO|nr:WD40 domain-containing protein [Cephalotus follicularis]
MIRGGKSYVSSPPSFSNDAKKLLVCTGDTVSIFSTTTALQISSLEGHTGPVTAVIVEPACSPANIILCYCWTASLDGTIKYWDFSVPELMKTIDIRLPIFSMVIPSLLSQQPTENNEMFAYVCVEGQIARREGKLVVCGHIKKCNLTKCRLAGGITLKETKKPELLIVSSSGKFLGVRVKRKLHIWKVPEMDSDRVVIKKVTLHHTKNMTVFAFHPTQRIMAAGDVTGRILIWRGFGDRTFAIGDASLNERDLKDDEERPGVRGDDDADSCTTWHWHPTEVNVLSFSSDGAYLYSGGNEGVLVVWQLDTGKKKFLPRIGSPLLYFTYSPDPSFSSISCADNQIHLLITPSMAILKSISGIKLPCSLPETHEGSCRGVAFDPLSGLVALCTENYCIQFYSLFEDRGISEVQVCERNHQPGDDITVIVNVVALSLDGSLMATSEVKLAEEGIGGLVCLKFWVSGSQKKELSLSTVIYEPHRDAGISAIAFHPTSRMAVSSSYGGDFKVWVCKDGIEQKDQKLQNTCWSCHAVGSYKKKAMAAATFSTDGSVLAVAAETFITLWDPNKVVLVAVIGESLMPIVTLSFVGNSEYLVSVSRGSKPQLSVWSLSKLSLSWSYKLNVEAVASAMDASSFAALILLPTSSKFMEINESSFQGRDGLILFFNANDPVPAVTWSVMKANGGGLAFLQVNPSSLEGNIPDGKSPQTLLAYINGDHEYVIFDPCGRESQKLNVIRKEGVAAVEGTGPFGYASLYGELPEFDPKRNTTSWVPSVSSERPWETIFSGSSHNLPPLTKLCSSFLESLLEKRTDVVE